MKKKYKDVTKEEIEKVINEVFGDIPNITYKELRDKLLDGYWYKINTPNLTESHPHERHINLNTGKRGVNMFLDNCEELHIPAGLIAKNILVYVEGAYHCILDLSHKINTPDKLNLEDKTLTNGGGDEAIKTTE